MDAPTPFTLAIPEADLAELRERLGRTRWPDQAPGESWASGTDLGYLRGLVEHWRTGFDWRAQEAALNAFPQFTATVDGTPVHFLHVSGAGPDPMPLLLHGWPGSVFEFLDIIPRLTDPARFGGSAQDSFTVVAPSLPGYGLSFRPGQRRFTVPDMAACLHALMTDVLGYRRFGVQGGDWGAAVAGRLAFDHPETVAGIHLNLLNILSRDPADFPNPSNAEQQYLRELQAWQTEEGAYGAIQGTRPQTLAYALTDSPAGLAGWIVEKFRAWSDCGGNVETAINRDRMLGNIAFYWFTGAIGSSFWPYYGRLHGAPALPPGARIGVPAGYAAFPREIMRPPREAAERVLKDVRRWTDMPRGGHFAALEQPDALAAEVAAFFGELRQGRGQEAPLRAASGGT